MVRRTMIGLVVAVAMFVAAPAALASTNDAVVSMTATVDSFGAWSDATPTIASGDWTGSVNGTTISQVGEDLTVTKALTLYANTNVTLSAAGTANSGIATNGSDTLTTSYKITGDVGTPDAAWKAAGSGAGEFFNAGNTYSVTHVSGDGSYAINLLVQLESANARAQDAGNYTCSLTLTATW
jgi:hypothetical protein